MVVPVCVGCVVFVVGGGLCFLFLRFWSGMSSPSSPSPALLCNCQVSPQVLSTQSFAFFPAFCACL